MRPTAGSSTQRRTTMSDTGDPNELPPDAPEADVIEQRQTLYEPEPESGPPGSVEADPADLMEQRTVAGVDDDDEW
jgi:hypothetical protein